MRGIPSVAKVAGIIWAECAGIRANATTVTSLATYNHRLAIGLCVVNRGRQNLRWGDNQQTCAPRTPTATELANPTVRQQWDETQRAARAAMATLSGPLACPENLYGAQLYVHTWTRAHTGRRLGGEFVGSYQAWDPRPPGPVWLSVHVIKARVRRALARAASAASP